MGFLRQGRQPPSQIPLYTGLQVQTSSNAVPITIQYGTNKIAPNAIWSGVFYAVPQYQKQGGKGGGGQQLQGYTYYTSFILGVCEGPINYFAATLLNQSFFFGLGWTGLQQSPYGATPQTPWGYLQANFPGQALGYNGLAYVAAANFNLGSTPSLPQFSFIIQGINAIWGGNVVNGLDSDPALIIQDFLTNAQYGVMFPAASIDATTLLSGSRSATVTISIASPGVVTWTAHGLSNGNAIVFATTGALPTGLTAGTVYYVVAASANTFEVALTPGAAPINSSGSQSGVQTATFWDSSYQNYCRASHLALSPSLTNQEAANSILARWLQLTNTAAVWSGGKLKFIPYGDSTVTGPTSIGNVTFNPNVTPLYNLTDDDFIHEDGKDPLEVVRSDPYASYNWQRLQINSRRWGVNYSAVPIDAWDQNAIELYGLRRASDITASEICDEAVAQVSAQLILQRQLYIRNTYAFKLSFEYCLLEPMNLVTVTDAALGLNNVAIRITAIEEDDAGLLAVTAEEFPGGTATAVQYSVQGGVPNSTNQAVVPARVNTPTIFEPPAALTAGVAQVWAAVSGGIAPAYKLAEDTSTGPHSAFQATPNAQAVGNTIVFSVYAQAAERSAFRINLNNGVPGVGCDFNLATGTAGTSDAGITAATITPAGGNWFQCSISSIMGALTVPTINIKIAIPFGTTSYAGTAGDGIYLWGAAYAWTNPTTGVAQAPTFLPAFSIFTGAAYTVNAIATPEGVAGVADPNWGGAFVWISTDNTTYGQIGTVTAPARQGVLTAAFAAPPGTRISRIRFPFRSARVAASLPAAPTQTRKMA
jgi:Putative phage tail protein